MKLICMHAYMHCMTKVISLSDEAYGSLKKMKGEDDSFSDVVMELTKERRKKNLMKFAGVWKDKPEMDKIFEEIFAQRKNFRSRDVKL